LVVANVNADVQRRACSRTTRLPRQRFHDLRHACATMMLTQGVAPRVVMETLGHSQISLTINTFSHVFPELGRAAAKPAAEHLNDDVSLAPIGQKCTILILMLSK
jgi:integrase